MCGVQMVALNFQTFDRATQINAGFFSQNGGCGYVVKPQSMSDGCCFDPRRPSVLNGESVRLRVAVLAGRLLFGLTAADSGDVFVRVELVGCPPDCASGTTSAAKGSFNPSWAEEFDFGIVHAPSLSTLRMAAYQQSSRNRSILLGQASVPLNCLRNGYR